MTPRFLYWLSSTTDSTTAPGFHNGLSFIDEISAADAEVFSRCSRPGAIVLICSINYGSKVGKKKDLSFANVAVPPAPQKVYMLELSPMQRL